MPQDRDAQLWKDFERAGKRMICAFEIQRLGRGRERHGDRGQELKDSRTETPKQTPRSRMK